MHQREKNNRKITRRLCFFYKLFTIFLERQKQNTRLKSQDRVRAVVVVVGFHCVLLSCKIKFLSVVSWHHWKVVTLGMVSVQC